MSTAAGAPSNGPSAGVKSPDRKKKGKSAIASPDISMEEEDEEDEDEDEEEMEEEEEDEDEGEEEEEQDELEEIDQGAIVGRRTRGLRVDYTSKEALEKAGLAREEDEEEEDEMKC